MNVVSVCGVIDMAPKVLLSRAKLKATKGCLKPLSGYIENVDIFTRSEIGAVDKNVLSRKNLKATNSSLKPLAGPNEKTKAEAWLVAYTLGNASLAALTAQAPGADEAALSAVEVAMAAHILRGIYKFKIGDTAIKSLLTGCTGAYVGSKTFKLLSKSLTWMPGIGNGLNALVSGSTTAALGAAVITMAEKMDDARRRGEKMDDFIRRMEDDNKKGGKK